MLLVTGLGNPGRQYQNTRHNIGFRLLDLLLDKNESWRTSKKEQTKFIKKEITGKTVVLLKPQTFMNNSGLAVVYASQKHHLKSEDMIVVHDDIDLPLGKIRISQNSSAGGHRGVQSVINHLKSKNFIHLKIGVGPIKRWPNFQAAKYVLQKFNNSEKKLLADSLQKAHKALLAIITDGPKKAMNQYN